MKKLIMLIFISMMSLNVFSQNVIDSTSIRLKKPIARLVIKDLITGDSYKEDNIAETWAISTTNISNKGGGAIVLSTPYGTRKLVSPNMGKSRKWGK
jgi:hypothetical protein